MKWGGFAGEIILAKDFPRFKVASDLFFNDLNVPNRRVFLELDYKSDEPFFIGFRGNRNGLSPDNLLDAVIAPKEDWNKIYFNIKTLKPMLPVLLMLSLVLFAAESYGSEQDFKFGQIIARGSGCPAGYPADARSGR